MKILIGYDGSVDADGALHDLASAGLPEKATVLVLTVATPWQPFGTDGQIPMGFSVLYEEHVEQSLRDAKAMAAAAAGSLRRAFPGWTVRSEAVLHQPALGILDKAEAWKPDLIVLGSHGRTALSRMLMGSVSQSVLHHADGTVRITRPRIRSKGKAPRLLVGVDGSGISESVVERIAARSWPRGTEVRVIGVLRAGAHDGTPMHGDASPFVAGAAGKVRSVLERTVSAAVETLAATGLLASPAVSEGEPRAVLLQEAESWAADCIFLGRRGIGAVKRLFLGSVSSAIASHAPCTVEVIRTAGGKRAGDGSGAKRKIGAGKKAGAAGNAGVKRRNGAERRATGR